MSVVLGPMRGRVWIDSHAADWIFHAVGWRSMAVVGVCVIVVRERRGARRLGVRVALGRVVFRLAHNGQPSMNGDGALGVTPARPAARRPASVSA